MTATGLAAVRNRRSRGRSGVWPYALLSPFLVVFVLFFVAPVVLSAYQSLFRDRVVGGRIFVGLENYGRVLVDPSFWGGVGRITLFTAIFLPLTLGLALFFAVALDSGVVRWAPFFRLTFFVPYAIPGVVAALMWGFLYGPSFGPLNEVARSFGFDGIDYLSKGAMLYSIGNIDLWLYVGYVMVIFFAALRAVPTELYEAAALDGATRRQIALRIQIPLIMPVISVMVLFSIIGTLQLFTEPTILRPLAPAVIGNDYVPNYYAYSLASTGQQFNYVSALAIVLAAIVLLASSAYLAISRLARSS